MSEILYNLLVVDDDERIRNLLSQYLIKEGFIVSTANGADIARKKIQLIKFDLIILDIMMPGDDGLTLTQEIRNNSDIPIILLTAKSGTDSKIEGLEIGADDYLTKPFNPKELLLRILSILKRSKAEDSVDNEIFFGDFILNIEKRELTKSKERVYLTDREMNLLIALAKSPGQPLNREKLAGIDEPGRSVDVGINRLRRKIEKDPRMPLWLQTVRGEGYILRPDK
ncbi:MAG: response regulator [Pseudomonadota bacterium]|nr:response regulator [Pseudomonadota bacterium]MEC9097997.1 response regulator [Pseudomonadota bacterium]MED5254018.1 response regulator [Pseudomonadota bacterium]MED5272565.1 response regulator [Pseudomonadota bacterium]MED5484247.1 response regulator [Pseudomonadota bacterium]